MNRVVSRALAGRALAGAATLMLLLGAAACGNQPDRGSADADAKSASEICPTAATSGTIKIAMSAPLAVFAPFLLAQETNAFADAGLTVEVSKIPSSESLPLVARGQLDAQLTSLSSSHFNTLNSGVGVKWIAPMDTQEAVPAGTPVPGYWARKELVGSAENPDLSKLKGAEVSTPTAGNGISGLILDNALKTAGLSLKDVDLVAPLVGPDALNGLKNKAVDVAWIAAPLEVEAAKDPNLVPVAGYAPGVTGTSLMAGTGLLNRPDVAVKFLEVLSDVTTKYLTGDYCKNPETVKLLAAAEETEASTIEQSALLTFDPTFAMTGTDTFAEQLQTFALTRGDLEYPKALPVDGLIDTRFTEALASCQ